MSYCPKCGAEIKEDYRFCPNCTTPIKDEDQSIYKDEQIRENARSKQGCFGFFSGCLTVPIKLLLGLLILGWIVKIIQATNDASKFIIPVIIVAVLGVVIWRLLGKKNIMINLKNNNHFAIIIVLVLIICSGIGYGISNSFKNNSEVGNKLKVIPPATEVQPIVNNKRIQINKDQLINYFSKDLDFKIDVPHKGYKDMYSVSPTKTKGDLTLALASIYYEGKDVKVISMSVFIDTSKPSTYENLQYINKLINKTIPDIVDIESVVKKGIEQAKKKRETNPSITDNYVIINENGKNLKFTYIKDAGGEKGSDAVIFKYDTTIE